jgi:Protein of unknown function (DUF1217)
MTGTIGINSVAWYAIVTRNKDRQLEQFAKQPTVQKAVERFRETAPKLDNVDALTKDRRSLEFVLTAFQLESQVDSRALLKKIMSEPLDDPKSLVNRLADPRYKKLAQAMQGYQKGVNPLATKPAVDSVVNAYLTNEFEKAKGEEANGLREAMYFKRNIAGITKLEQLMSDKPLMEVARVALGLPEKFALLSFEQQASRLKARLDVKNFQDPKFVEKMVRTYLVKRDIEEAGPPPSTALTLLSANRGDGSEPASPIGLDLPTGRLNFTV